MNHIYIIGGDDISAVQIYDINNNTWIINNTLPNINQIRRIHACSYYNSIVYVIGGLHFRFDWTYQYTV